AHLAGHRARGPDNHEAPRRAGILVVTAQLRIEEVSLRLPDCAIQDINLEVVAGEYLGVMGPTGAGKTVLLEIIAGLRQPDRGRVWLDGQDLTHTPACCRGVAYVPQDYALFPHMSVSDNIAYGLVEQHIAPSEAAPRVQQMAERLGVEHLLARRPRSLSGGEAQRVALARALVLRSPLLLLDEPLAAVDERTREELIRQLQALQREWPMSVVHVSHSFDEALAVADRLCVLHSGRVAQIGPAEEIMRRPNCEFMALFTGCENIVTGEVSRSAEGSQFRRGELELHVDCDWQGGAQLVIRPEDIRLLAESSSERQNTLQGRVVSSGNRGSFWKSVVEVGGVEWSVLCSRYEAQALGLSVGMAVSAEFPVACLHPLAAGRQ
ncbi:MAG: ABC transporter ATP-binding protein, partial [Armatimonadota bacterium]